MFFSLVLSKEFKAVSMNVNLVPYIIAQACVCVYCHSANKNKLKTHDLIEPLVPRRLSDNRFMTLPAVCVIYNHALASHLY